MLLLVSHRNIVLEGLTEVRLMLHGTIIRDHLQHESRKSPPEEVRP